MDDVAEIGGVEEEALEEEVEKSAWMGEDGWRMEVGFAFGDEVGVSG